MSAVPQVLLAHHLKALVHPVHMALLGLHLGALRPIRRAGARRGLRQKRHDLR